MPALSGRFTHSLR